MTNTIPTLPAPTVSQTPRMLPKAATTPAASADKFETMAIAAFLKPIFATMGKAEAPFGGGSVEKHFQPFLIDAIAKSMEQRGGLGLKPMLESAIAAAPHAKTGSTGMALPPHSTSPKGSNQ